MCNARACSKLVLSKQLLQLSILPWLAWRLSSDLLNRGFQPLDRVRRSPLAVNGVILSHRVIQRALVQYDLMQSVKVFLAVIQAA